MKWIGLQFRILEAREVCMIKLSRYFEYKERWVMEDSPKEYTERRLIGSELEVGQKQLE